MSVAFSTPDSDIIAEKVPVIDISATSSSELQSRFHLDDCSQWIGTNGFSQVALQFPDELLPDATPISMYLTSKTDANMFILADTSYGSCCVDEIAAEHVSADCLIHFGHSCLSSTCRLPVKLVFNDMPLDVSSVAKKVQASIQSARRIVVFTDVRYNHSLLALCEELKLVLDSCQVFPAQPALLVAAGSSNLSRFCTILNRRVALTRSEVSDATVLFIGSESRTLVALAMCLSDVTIISYNPIQPEISPMDQQLNTARAVRRRYYLVEKARDSERVGILVGTLAVRQYQEIISRLKRLLRSAGKRYYTLACGKLNAAKLANFPELDVLVLVSCAESALLESRDFLRPVVTPYEMELACNPSRQWCTPGYVADFIHLLPGGSDYVPEQEIPADFSMDVSLITGKLRRFGVESGSASADPEGAVQLRDPMSVALHMGGAAQALVERSWRGLEVNSGGTPVQKVMQGMQGIAVGYSGEGKAAVSDPTEDTLKE